mgnify:CR=1 FL=1
METKKEDNLRKEIKNSKTSGLPINQDFMELIGELLALKRALIKKLSVTQAEIDAEK